MSAIQGHATDRADCYFPNPWRERMGVVIVKHFAKPST